VLPQSRRHAFIASLLGIPNVIVAVNKMDLVDFSKEVFDRICADFTNFARDLSIPNIYFIPISALDGDNVVTDSPRTPWYTNGSLLRYLEEITIDLGNAAQEMRFPVQYVVRQTLDFRGYAGQISSGTIRPGDPIMVLPSGRTSRVKSITTFDGDLPMAHAPMSVTVCLEDELDISRGDMLVPPARMPHASRRLEAMVVWMHSTPLELQKDYLVKHTTQQVRANVTSILHRVDINTLAKIPAQRLELNEIAAVSLETHKPLFFDPYRQNRMTGSFIFIDPVTNSTLGAGMILARASKPERSRNSTLLDASLERSRLTPAERWARAGHRPAAVWLTARLEVAYQLERELFDRGYLVHILADEIDSHLLPDLAKICSAAGLITICSVASSEHDDLERAREMVGEGFLDIDPEILSPQDNLAVQQICAMLEQHGIIGADHRNTAGDGI